MNHDITPTAAATVGLQSARCIFTRLAETRWGRRSRAHARVPALPPINGGRSVRFVRFGYRRIRRRDAIADMLAQLAELPDLPPAPPSA